MSRFSRALREEVDRVRSAERDARRAIDDLAQARGRLESLVGAVLAREEARAQAPSEPGPREPESDERVSDEPGSDGDAHGSAPPPERAIPVGPGGGSAWAEEPDSGFVPVLVGVMAVVLLLAGGGWLGVQRGWLGPATSVPSGPSVAVGPEADDAVTPPSFPAPVTPADTGAATDGVADGPPLPADPTARAAVYDSLWTARSPLFDPLLEALEEETAEKGVGDAVRAWRDGGSLDPLVEDRLHSALLQMVLARETGEDLALDGQVLRNPCRGSSCGALLELWEADGDRLGLPSMPDDVGRNPDALATAERVLILRALEA